MGREIERKFLVSGDGWRAATPVRYRQGYIADGKGVTVRVRVAGEQGFLTLKGPSDGMCRAEYEYGIPLKDAQEMLNTL